MVAFSTATAETLAILRDEGWLTDIRPAIGGELATLALARSDARVTYNWFWNSGAAPSPMPW